jgi:integrase
MMRLFKAAFKNRRGGRQQTSKWYVEFRDHRDREQRLPAFTNRVASDELGRNVEKLVAFHSASGGHVAPDLQTWLVGLPKRIRERLIRIGLVDARRAAISKPLAEHRDDFLAALRAKGTSPKHVRLLGSRLERVLDECGFKEWTDVTGERFQAWLGRLRESTETDDDTVTPGLSAQTSNFYLQAMKQFCRWAVRERRIAESPLSHLTGLNVRLDRRHDRRSLSTDELRVLVEKTWNGPVRFGMTGPERAMLYRVATETGLRVGELRSLTPWSFDTGDAPTVKVAAAYSKRRREDVLPLRPETARDLASFLVVPEADQPIFRIPEKPAEMMRADLDASREEWLSDAKSDSERERRRKTLFLRYADDAGRVADFHALRHTFISNLARSGIHPKLAQDLARHSDINLTMSRYSHTEMEERAVAVRRLPSVPLPAASSPAASLPAARQSAEPGRKNRRFVLPSCLPEKGVFPCLSPDQHGLNGRLVASAKTAKTPGKTAFSAGKTESHRRDSNPQPAVYKTAALPIVPRWHAAPTRPPVWLAAFTLRAASERPSRQPRRLSIANARTKDEVPRRDACMADEVPVLQRRCQHDR